MKKCAPNVPRCSLGYMYLSTLIRFLFRLVNNRANNFCVKQFNKNFYTSCVGCIIIFMKIIFMHFLHVKIFLQQKKRRIMVVHVHTVCSKMVAGENLGKFVASDKSSIHPKLHIKKIAQIWLRHWLLHVHVYTNTHTHHSIPHVMIWTESCGLLVHMWTIDWSKSSRVYILSVKKGEFIAIKQGFAISNVHLCLNSSKFSPQNSKIH